VIVYSDSSSIVKWFFDEPLMDLARGMRDKAEMVFTSLISFPEVMSAFNRAWREARCSKSDMELVRGEFLRIWPGLHWIKTSEALMRQAGQLIFWHNLRGFDAVHLASALLLKKESNGIDLFFSCFNKDLNQAAQKEGFITHNELQRKIE
jgi:predicted nucleic acid-binding protein